MGTRRLKIDSGVLGSRISLRRGALAGALLVLIPVVAGCGPGWGGRPAPEPGSAVLTAIDDGLEGVESDLASKGIRHRFVPVGTLEVDDGGTPSFERRDLPGLKTRLPITLVVEGRVPPVERRAAQSGERLADALEQIKNESEGLGWRLEGVHLDLTIGGPTEGLDDWLAAVRRGIDRDLSLALTLPVGWLPEVTEDDDRREEALEALAPILRRLDYFVLDVYGQPAGQRDDPGRWDDDTILGLAERAELVPMGWMARFGLEGYALVRRADQGTGSMFRALPLEAMLSSGSFELVPQFAFEGFHRHVFDLVTRSDWQESGLAFEQGDRLRVVRPSPLQLATLVASMRELSPALLGEIWQLSAAAGAPFALSATPEELSIGLGASGGKAERGRITAVTSLSGSGRSWRLRVGVEQAGGLPTAPVDIDHNYLEIRLQNGTFGDVELGDFHRVRLGRVVDGEVETSDPRRASVLQLYYPLLEPGWSPESGSVRVYTRGQRPAFEVGGHWLMADGSRIPVSAASPTASDPPSDPATRP